MRLFLSLAIAASILTGARAQTLESGFANPPRAMLPQVWWWFPSGAGASSNAITRDLEALRSVGISGFHIYGGSDDPVPAWRARVRWALHEAHRLDLDGILSIGCAGCISQRTPPELAQKELVWTTARTGGGQLVQVDLPRHGATHTPRNDSDVPRYYWDIVTLAFPDRDGPVRLDEITDVSAYLNPTNDTLAWPAPPGSWVVLRVGYAPNLFGYGGSCFIDHLSRRAFDFHWGVIMEPLLAELAPDERAALKGVMCDSWECGTVSWTETFAAEFKARRGYDLTQWLPGRCGFIVETEGKTERFNRDYALTISELIAENHYAYQKEVANRHGLVSIAEAAGPHQHQADVRQLIGRCDVAMGEFWMPSAHRPTPPQRFLVRDAATAAHVYGISDVLAESFTTIGTFWTEYPATLKPCADRAFCDGLNRVCYHGMAHSPSLTDRPGRVRDVGTQFNPQVTWFPECGAFNRYLGRCAWMLHQGHFVADALLYAGDAIDAFAGMKTPSDALGDGYDYDFCPTELLMKARVEQGAVVLPSGMRYRVLMISDKNPESAHLIPGPYAWNPAETWPPVVRPVTEAVMGKLLELVRAGATLAGPRPNGPSSMFDSSTEYHIMANELWGPRDNTDPAVRRVGEGRVIPVRADARKVLAADGVGPDFAVALRQPAGARVDWIHRRMEGADIYFVASGETRPVSILAQFRQSSGTPGWWDPVTGSVSPLKGTRQGSVMRVPLRFEANGSGFVVFRDAPATAAPLHESAWSKEIAGPWKVRFDRAWGGPAAEETFGQLTDWRASKVPGVRYYSGTAVYRQTFDLPAQQPGEGPFVLDLGRVEVIASVRLNGVELGTAWTAPYRLRIAGALKSRGNKLEIRVTNLWPNRLIGDSGLPVGKRLTHTNINPYRPDSPLLPSGLLGPVVLRAGLR